MVLFNEKRRRASQGMPPFRAGDIVTPNGLYNYTGNHKWPEGEAREVYCVKQVSHSPSEAFWVLCVWNPSMGKYSEYNPRNFKIQQERNAMYEKAKFIGVLMDSNLNNNIPDQLLSNAVHYTDMKDTMHQVRVDVAKMIKPGDRWMVLQTVALLEGEEPRPPIRVTEYK